MAQEKYCPRCETVKLMSEFYRNRATRDGLLGRCKECDRGYGRRWNRTNREYKAQVARERRIEWRETTDAIKVSQGQSLPRLR